MVVGKSLWVTNRDKVIVATQSKVIVTADCVMIGAILSFVRGGAVPVVDALLVSDLVFSCPQLSVVVASALTVTLPSATLGKPTEASTDAPMVRPKLDEKVCDSE